ncbi:MAG TPA: hypothetical protein VHC90_15940 [Bryobacteraceae bacterium]|nr:hypothetical protein [Bryobacteraceae bacterium]
MKLKVFAVVIGCAVSLAAQTPMTIGGDTVTKMVTLQYPDRVSTNIIDGIGLTVRRTDNLVVITGPKERVETAEAILHQLDTPAPPRPPLPPKKDIQVTAYLIIASASGTQTTPLPKDLEPAVNQIASILSYKSFHLFDAVVLRTSEGAGGQVAGILPVSQQTFLSGGDFQLRINRVELTPATPANLLRLSNFDLMVYINRGVDREGKDKKQMVDMGTSIDMKEGQKVVVGKANIDGSENALLVILTAQVVD